MLRIKGTSKGVALTTDCNARQVYLDPRRGAAMAVAEAARNLSVSGRAAARPHRLPQLRLARSGPEILWQFKEAVAGIGEACRALDIPVVGGNVSFYNETLGQAILPTPVIGMAGILEDAEARATQWFQEEGDRIALIGPDAVSLGGSRVPLDAAPPAGGAPRPARSGARAPGPGGRAARPSRRASCAPRTTAPRAAWRWRWPSAA